MHKMLSARPNINPRIITTGVGPQALQVTPGQTLLGL